jgi:tetratricopeptide (TPR) repeat protein
VKTKASNKPTTRIPAGSDVEERCALAQQLTRVGNYEGAREAFGTFWSGIGQQPHTDGLEAPQKAELLLRVGALSAWMGSASQVAGAQEFAKDLISESIRAFEAIGNQEKIAEAQSDLALCYWREGAMDEARVYFRDALSRAEEPSNKLRILTRSTTVEYSSGRFEEALSLLNEAAPLLDEADDAALGCYYLQRALVFERLGGAANLDRALIDSAAASVHLERANHRRYYARVQNNMGLIFRTLGRHEEALDHLERARRTFFELDDKGTVAQVNETRARVFIEQGLYSEAEKAASSAVLTHEQGDEKALLAEALEAQGIAHARLGRNHSALEILTRAAELAQEAGDPEFAGRIFLTILEELGSSLEPGERARFYGQADGLLGDQLSSETTLRLRACARLMLSRGESTDAVQGSFQEEVLRCERSLLKSALDKTNGRVTRAARLLGLSHQGLCYIINNRHKELLEVRAPIKARRKSPRKPRKSRRQSS